jgi:hypothetical protein
MSRLVSNVNIITDTFEGWLLQTNQLLHALSNEIITANTTYANTGNSTISRVSQLYGTFGANTISVTNSLRGGNASGGYDVLTIVTNTVFSNVSVLGLNTRIGNTTINSVSNSSSVLISNRVHSSSLTEGRLLVGNSTVNTVSNSTIISIANSTSSANINPTSLVTGISTVNTTVISVGANVFSNSTSIYVGNSTFSSVFGNASWTSAANLTITPTSYLKIVGSVNVSSNATFANTLAVTGAATLSNTIAVTGNTTLSNTLTVTGAVTLSNTATITGNTTINGNIIFKTDYILDLSSNTDVGSGVGNTNQKLIYSFSTADYESAKMQIKIKNTNIIQTSELLLSQNGTSVFITTYGSVSSNGSASALGTFSANIDTTTVRLYLNQTTANSSVKIVSNLIK